MNAEQILPVVFDGDDHFLKLPFLVKGEIEYAPDVDIKKVREAFKQTAELSGCHEDNISYVRLDNAQVVREKVLAHGGQRSENGYVYQVMPVVDPVRMGFFNPADLADSLYDLPFDNILEFLGRLNQVFTSSSGLAARVKEITEVSAVFPSEFLDIAFASFGAMMNPFVVAGTVDSGLAFMGRKGREFLNGWVDMPLPVSSGPAMLNADMLFKQNSTDVSDETLAVRAMPTRQLHITAGNAPGIPFVSALRSFSTKSAALIKMPYGVTLPGALLALGMVEAGPDHPLTKNTSIIYWPGGDEEIENVFYQQDFFDRIVVWGAPGSVSAVKSKALFTKVLTFNPRYAMTMIGKEAFEENIESVAVRASTDTMIWNQKACIASLVHYVEGSEEDALSYCEALARVMKKWDSAIPNYTPDFINGQIRRMRRGKLAGAKWFFNRDEKGQFQSAVVFATGEFDMADHPMGRLIIVRRVGDLSECVKYLNASVSTVGVYPEKRRKELRSKIAACGISNIVRIGMHERLIPGAPHDGMMVFAELVDWKNA